MSSSHSISITQALAELKLLRNRLDKALEDARFITMVTKKSSIDPTKFSTQARASLQKYRDLHERYNRIKAAIVQSNATAVVTIAGKVYTIAEAVERKRSLHFEEALILKLQEQWNSVQAAYSSHQQAEQHRIDRLLSTELSKDTKTNVDVIQSLTKTFLEDGKAEIIDPLNLDTLIQELKSSLEEFTTNVDWVLSEANGRTMITI